MKFNTLFQFFCILLVVVAAEIAACVWAYTNATELKSLVKVSFQKTIEEEYGIINSRTVTVDTIQSEVSFFVFICLQFIVGFHSFLFLGTL